MTQPQDVAGKSSSHRGLEALWSQDAAEGQKPNKTGHLSGIFPQGYPQVTCISKEGRVRRACWVSVARMSRRERCRKASSLCWALAWLLSCQRALAATTRRRRRSFWSIPRRSLWSQCSQASTSNDIGWAFGPPRSFSAVRAFVSGLIRPPVWTFGSTAWGPFRQVSG